MGAHRFRAIEFPVEETAGIEFAKETGMGLTNLRETLESIARRTLLERRRSLMERRENTEREAQELLEEREPDWEDRAANVTAAGALESLAEDERIQLARIDSALERIAQGTWGWCVTCGGPIPAARLRVVPEATRCSSCTNHH
jgi:RNA polymerase-binding transcription factor DksA